VVLNAGQLFVFGKEGDEERLVETIGGENAARTVLLFPSDEAKTVDEITATHATFSDNSNGPPLQIMVVDGEIKCHLWRDYVLEILIQTDQLCFGTSLRFRNMAAREGHDQVHGTPRYMSTSRAFSCTTLCFGRGMLRHPCP